MADRFGVLRQYPWPALTPAGLASGMRWLMLLTAAAYVVWRARATGWSLSPGAAPEAADTQSIG